MLGSNFAGKYSAKYHLPINTAIYQGCSTIEIPYGGYYLTLLVNMDSKK